MPRNLVAYSPKDEHIIDDNGAEVVVGTRGDDVGSSSMNSGAVSFQGQHQGMVTGEGIDERLAKNLMYSGKDGNNLRAYCPFGPLFRDLVAR